MARRWPAVPRPGPAVDPGSGTDSPVSTLRSTSNRSRANEPEVGRDDVARLQQDDVTGTRSAAGTSIGRRRAAYPRRGRRRLAEGLEGALAAVLGDHVGTDDRQ